MHILYKLLLGALLHFMAWQHSRRRHIELSLRPLCSLKSCTNHPAENKTSAGFPTSPAGSGPQPPDVGDEEDGEAKLLTNLPS